MASTRPAPALPPVGAPVRGPRRVARLGSMAARMPWIAVVVPFAALYLVVALSQPLPMYTPDEPLYLHLARSLAEGDGLTWRGDHPTLRSALYAYLISPAWLVSSGVAAVHIAKVATVVLSCLVAMPVWLLARSVLSRPLALLAVALSLAGTWMVTGTGLMTESIALPLATASLALLVATVRRPRSRLTWLALLLAVLATWARLQLAVLVPIILLALALDVALAGPDRGARLRQHRGPLAVVGGLLGLALLALALRGSGLAGGYSGALHFRPAAGSIARVTAIQLLHLAALCGFLPLLLLAVLATRRAAWHDELVGPLLVVLVPTVAVLAIESGFYVSGADLGWAIQRYVAYAGPLLLLFTLVALSREGLVGWRTGAAGCVLALASLATPAVTVRLEEGAVFGTTERVRDVVPGASSGVAVALAAIVLGVVVLAAIAARRGRDRRSVAAVGGGALLVLLLAQTLTLSLWQVHVTRVARADLPRDLAWVDHHARTAVGVLEAVHNWPDFYAVDFYNSKIQRYYILDTTGPGPGVEGHLCQWHLEPDGTALFDPACGRPPPTLLINDPTAHLTFYDETSTAREPHLGRLVTVAGRPRVMAIVTTPCSRPTQIVRPITMDAYPKDQPVACSPRLAISTWLDRPATVIVGLRGAPSADHRVRAGGRTIAVPARRITTLRLRVHSGRRETVIDLDWAQRSPDDARLATVELGQDGVRRSLL